MLIKTAVFVEENNNNLKEGRFKERISLKATAENVIIL